LKKKKKDVLQFCDYDTSSVCSTLWLDCLEPLVDPYGAICGGGSVFRSGSLLSSLIVSSDLLVSFVPSRLHFPTIGA
jgi:hypothetical protein